MSDVDDAEVFALIRDDETVVVNLGALREPMTIHALCDLLGLSYDEFVDALDRQGNEMYRLVLYESVWEFLGGELYDVVDGTVLLPEAKGLMPEQVVEWLGYVFSRVGVGGWKLPPGDLEVPRNPALLTQLASVEKRRPDPMVWFEVVAFEGAEAAIVELERRVNELAAVMKERRRQIAAHGAWAASLDRARTLVALQREYWKFLRTRPGVEYDEAAAYAQRDVELADLDAHLSATAALIRDRSTAKMAWKEKAKADALIAMFVEGDAASTGLVGTLAVYVEQPTALRASQHQRLVAGLQDAFAMLAASESVDRFLLNHFLPLLRAVCEGPAGRLEEVLARMDAKEVAQAVAQNWTDAFDAAGEAAQHFLVEPSTLGVLNNLGGGYKATMAIVGAGLHPRLIARFLHMVNLSNNDVAGVLSGRGAWSVGTALMRYVGMLATPFSSHGGDRGLRVAGMQYDLILKCTIQASQGDEDARAVLARMKLSENMMRSPLGMMLSVVIDSAALLFVLRREESDDVIEDVLSLGAVLAGGVAGNALKVLEYRMARNVGMFDWVSDDLPLRKVEKVSAGLSAVLCVVTVAIQVRVLQRKKRRGSLLSDYWQEIVPAVGAGASFGAWIAGLFVAGDGLVGAASAVAAGLGAVGALIGVGALVLAVTNWLTEAGAGPLFESLVSHASAAGDEYQLQARFKALAKAKGVADDGTCFVVFSSRPPIPPSVAGDGRTMGVPTWHRMAELGFSPREVGLAFDDPAARIAMAAAYGEEPNVPRE